MRTYAPAGVERVVDDVLAEPSLARGVVHHEVIPAREAIYAPFPDWLDPRIAAGLASRGIHQLYGMCLGRGLPPAEGASALAAGIAHSTATRCIV